jgi:hypothetical protein
VTKCGAPITVPGGMNRWDMLGRGGVIGACGGGLWSSAKKRKLQQEWEEERVKRRNRAPEVGGFVIYVAGRLGADCAGSPALQERRAIFFEFFSYRHHLPGPPHQGHHHPLID